MLNQSINNESTAIVGRRPSRLPFEPTSISFPDNTVLADQWNDGDDDTGSPYSAANLTALRDRYSLTERNDLNVACNASGVALEWYLKARLSGASDRTLFILDV